MDAASIINNFSGGQLSRTLSGRYELPATRIGLRQCYNFIPLLQGPAKFRPGSFFIARTKNNASPLLIPFVFNEEQTYMMEFTDGALRFFDNDSLLTESSKSITGVSISTTAAFSLGTHGYLEGEELYIDDLTGSVDVLNGQFYTISGTTADTFTLEDIFGVTVSTQGLSYVSGGSSARVYSISTPYEEADLDFIQVAQDGDILYAVDGYHEIQKISRVLDTNWTITSEDRTNDPFKTADIAAITQANPCKITTSAAHNLTEGEDVHLRSIEGMVELNDNTYAVAVVDSTNFTLVDSTGTAVDSTGYNAYTSGGYVFAASDQPQAVGIYGGRIFYGGTLNNPDGFWGSRAPSDTGLKRFSDFTLGTEDDDAVVFYISSTDNTVDRIKWFAGSSQFLGIGALNDVYKVTGAEGDGSAITANSISVKPIGSFGVAGIPPARFGPSIFYIQRGRIVLNSFEYDLFNNGYTPIDQSVLNPEIAERGLRKLSFQQGAPSLIWSIDDSGRLLSLTYKASESISAWAEHQLGGTDVKVTSIATEPQDTNQDFLWMNVSRTINGQTMNYIERFSVDPNIPQRHEYFTGDKDVDDSVWRNLILEVQSSMVRCDSALVINGEKNTTLTLSALTGSDVTVTAGEDVFEEEDIEKHITVKGITGFETGYARIHTFISATQVKVEVEQDFNSLTWDANTWMLSFDTVNGLNHLEGETVAILGDGGVGIQQTVSNGSVTMNSDYFRVVIGEPYKGVLEGMPISVSTFYGPSLAKTLTINEIGVLYVDAMGFSYGRDRYNLKVFNTLETTDYTTFPPLLKGGRVRLPARAGHKREMTYVLAAESPEIVTFSGVVYHVSVGDEE